MRLSMQQSRIASAGLFAFLMLFCIFAQLTMNIGDEGNIIIELQWRGTVYAQPERGTVKMNSQEIRRQGRRDVDAADSLHRKSVPACTPAPACPAPPRCPAAPSCPMAEPCSVTQMVPAAASVCPPLPPPCPEAPPPCPVAASPTVPLACPPPSQSTTAAARSDAAGTASSKWVPPPTQFGALPSFAAYMESLPPNAREVISQWRSAEYAKQVHQRRERKYSEQVHNKDFLTAARANATAWAALDEHDVIKWYTTEPKESLERRKRDAEEGVKSSTAAAAQLRGAAQAAAQAGGFPLPISATSPLPPQPVWRTLNVSLLLQYWEHPQNIEEICARLYKCTHGNLGDGQLGAGVTSELLVNVDSRGDGEVWDRMAALYANGSFVTPVLSNNLHEVHGYNRLAGIARGTVLVVMQDDDMPPASCSWLGYLLAEFERHPLLGAVGLRNGNLWHPSDALDSVLKPPANRTHMGEPWERCREGQNYHGSVYRDPEVGLPFEFVTVVDMAPLAFRAEAFKAIGMFDEGLAEQGECAILADWEISMRVWLGGWQVALIKGAYSAFGRAGSGGTHASVLSTAVCWHKQPSLFGGVVEERMGQAVGAKVWQAVAEANQGLESRLDLSTGAKPPWEACCVHDDRSGRPPVPGPPVAACPLLTENEFPKDWPSAF